jgi:nucleoside-diphosphate-sugar epimerase
MHVVLGANGSLGSAVIGRLADQGKPSRGVVRSRDLAGQLLPPSVEIAVGDATDTVSLQAACRGATVVYHCVNVPYQRWESVMPRALENVLSAARETGAGLVFPGNVYGYGRFQKLPATEDHPLAATSRKGRLRNALEAKLMEAHRSGEVSVVIPRLPDFYGPNVTNRLMAPKFRAALVGGTARWIGKLDVPHDLVYIDDAARACILLGSTEAARGQVWHVPGPGPVTGRQFLRMVFEAAGTPPRIGTLSGRAIRFFALFSVDAREMGELLYEFEEPLILDGGKFAQAFPSFGYTPHTEAIRRTLEWFRQHH